MGTYNIYGGSNKVNYDHCEIKKETENAVLLETTSSEGSYLHDYKISFWLPKSVFYKNMKDEGAYGKCVTIPFYFHLDVKKQKIG